MASLKLKVSLLAYTLEDRGLVKLGKLSGEDLDIYFWCRILDVKLAISVIMDLVSDMATDVKMEMSPRTLGISSLFLYLF